jgi:hypothetical protein
VYKIAKQNEWWKIITNRNITYIKSLEIAHKFIRAKQSEIKDRVQQDKEGHYKLKIHKNPHQNTLVPLSSVKKSRERKRQNPFPSKKFIALLQTRSPEH